MDAADLIASFATGTYTVTRRQKAGMTQGRATPGATSTLTISASVQPATGRDLLRLPEGRRSMETRVLFTSSQLMIGAQGAAYESDLVAIDGQSWEVQQVQAWEGAASTDAYYRVIVQAAA